MRIKRAPTGSRWFVVQDTDGGREIRHSSKATLDEAVTYLEGWGDPAPTRQELAVLERDDARVRFRQRHKRLPADDAELDEWVSPTRDD